jgi:hypothetical protein
MGQPFGAWNQGIYIAAWLLLFCHARRGMAFQPGAFARSTEHRRQDARRYEPVFRRNGMNRLILAVSAALTAAAANAGVPQTVPEPGTFELLALGGVIAVVIAIRRRRK